MTVDRNNNAKILVVDDEEKVLKFLSTLLSLHGYVLETAQNGMEAIQKAEKTNPDIIILDILMPEIDGLEACKRLKTNPKTRHIPIIVLTSVEDKVTKLQCLEAGANDFLTKPVDHVELTIRIHNLLQLKNYEDIKRKNKILTGEKKRLELIAQNIGAGLYIIDKDYNIRWQNKIMDKLFGELKEGEKCYKKYLKSDNPCICCPVYPVLNGVEIFSEEKTMILKNGIERYFLCTATPITDIDGNINEVIVIISDITERKMEHKRLEETLRIVEEAKKEWEQTVDCIDDVVILVDAKDNILRCNKILSTLTGKSYSELLNRKWQDVLRESGFTQKITDTGDVEIFHPSGKYFNYNIFYFKNAEDKNKYAAVITLKDITELKILTESLEITNMTLDKDRKELQFALDEISFLLKEVEEKKDLSVRFMGLSTHESEFIYTIGNHFNSMMDILESQHKELEKAYADLKAAQSQILQQEKMASIGQLAAGIAHEINNPMGFIISNLGSLSRYTDKLSEFLKIQAEAIEGLSSHTKEMGGNSDEENILNKLKESRKSLKIDYILSDLNNLIRESLDGAERVKKIVQDLKSFSRVDEAEWKVADINAGIESTINIVWNEIKYKATVKKQYGDIPMTKCNPGQLNQVFMNILVNAAQAIEKHGEITIKTWHDNSYIYVSISDTGCGIPANIINRIFEPFFTTKEVGKGTGLGLSIAYDIVKKHNGDIIVESEFGKGTTFTVKIPIVEK